MFTAGRKLTKCPKLIPTVTRNVAVSAVCRRTVSSWLRMSSSPGGLIALMRSAALRVSHCFHSASFFFSFCPPNFSLIDTHFWRSFFSRRRGRPSCTLSKLRSQSGVRTDNETKCSVQWRRRGRRASWKRSRDPDWSSSSSSLMERLHHVASGRKTHTFNYEELSQCSEATRHQHSSAVIKSLHCVWLSLMRRSLTSNSSVIFTSSHLHPLAPVQVRGRGPRSPPGPDPGSHCGLRSVLLPGTSSPRAAESTTTEGQLSHLTCRFMAQWAGPSRAQPGRDRWLISEQWPGLEQSHEISVIARELLVK